MTGPRLRYILGGAVLGAVLGAVYANYLYALYGHEESETEIIVPNHTPASNEVIDNEPERAASAGVQRRAAKSREVTDSNE